MEKKLQAIEGIHYATGRPVRLHIANGIILSVEDPGTGTGNGHRTSRPDPDKIPVIAPGLVDLQVNGFKGVDFNDPGLTPEQVETASAALLHSGVTGYYPTLITGPVERITLQLGTLSRAVRNGGLTGQMVQGIHLEGPFISREEGPRGAHPVQYCLDPDAELVKRWQEAAGGGIRILTLAPELPGSGELIRTCRRMGLVVGIAHTAAGTEEIRRAADAGATLSTHLGNGCHALLPRHPNYLWDQLADERLHASMIADGFHLPDEVLKVFIRVKGKKAILVSDSMNYSGMPPGLYQSAATGKVRLTNDGKLHLEGQPGTLAGSASRLMDGVRRIARLEGLAYALEMASVHPSRLMDLSTASGMVEGAPADLVIMEKEGDGMKLLKVLKLGEEHSLS
jgi:N-acetylglucosamine-6-phosphate deacetylase